MVGQIFRKFGVQSKILAMVLAASLLSLLLTGFVSFGIAHRLLTEAGYSHLISLRNDRAEAIKNHFEQLQDHIQTMSEAQMTVSALKEFSAAITQLPDISEPQQKILKLYYNDDWLPKLKKNIGGEPRLATYYPPTPSARYLKYHYVAANPHASNRSMLDDAGDGSQWTAVHKKFHPRFRRIANLYKYHDILLVDIKTGNVVYSVANEVDLGTNLLNGPFADSVAAKAFAELKKSRDPQSIFQTDVEPYKPGLGVPTSFIGGTVFDGDQFIGAILVQLDTDAIDKVMTANRHWSEVGLGRTGETYLVGKDFALRSSPRSYLENTPEYIKKLKKDGLDPKKIALIQTSGTPLLVQEIRTEGVRRALEGKSSTASYRDYRGMPVIGAYQPIELGPFSWALLAEIDRAEIFAGIQNLARTLLLLAAILIPLLTLLSLNLARNFIKPIHRLMEATKAIAAGQKDVAVTVTSDDEFGELSKSFNQMANNLAQREDSINTQLAENDRLLLSILPAKTAERLKKGEKMIADSYPSVTVLFADIEGFNSLSEQLAPEQTILLLNELIGAFDEAAERLGMEKLRSVGSSYLAVCGLSIPRVDHQRRSVEFGFELLQITNRLNQKRQVDLSLDIGIHTGSISAGVVGSHRFYYDVWGETITIARSIGSSASQNLIRVSEPVMTALRGLYRFDHPSQISVKGQGDIAVWEIQPLSNAASPLASAAESPQIQGSSGTDRP